MTLVKICGLKTPDAITAAIESGADFVGLVFHPDSPRFVETEIASYLAHYVPESVKIVGLFVDPTDQKLDEILSNVRLDILQLHGTETPERMKEIKARYGKPLIKALSISRDTVNEIAPFSPVCDWLMLDHKGGGTGQPFDWALLDGRKIPTPWMLAGGLTPETVAEAIARLKPDAVDVSSGVESSRGVKDPARIKAFLHAVKSL